MKKRGDCTIAAVIHGRAGPAGHLDIARFLVEAGADKDLTEYEDMTARTFAFDNVR